MAQSHTNEPGRTPIALRRPERGLKDTFLGVTRQNFGLQMLAGVTLLAIAIPEQLATSQLAGVFLLAGVVVVGEIGRAHV
jgi:hypothetical protein